MIATENKMKTIINSNGSKWAGESPDSVDDLLRVLGEYALDRTFEDYGDFVMDGEKAECYGFEECDSVVHFFGNFLNLSHVFNIYTNDPAVIEALTAAIRENQKREDYVSQPCRNKCEVCLRRAANNQEAKRLCRTRTRTIYGRPHLATTYRCERCLESFIAEEIR